MEDRRWTSDFGELSRVVSSDFGELSRVVEPRMATRVTRGPGAPGEHSHVEHGNEGEEMVFCGIYERRSRNIDVFARGLGGRTALTLTLSQGARETGRLGRADKPVPHQ
jgi:hypothetical protein